MTLTIYRHGHTSLYCIDRVCVVGGSPPLVAECGAGGDARLILAAGSFTCGLVTVEATEQHNKQTD